MNRVQQGHQQALVGQDDGRLDARFFLVAQHTFHFVERLLGLPYRRGHGDHSDFLIDSRQRLQWHGIETTTVAVNEQGTRIMGRMLQQGGNARIVPPEIGFAASLEMVKQLDLGDRQHTESHEHHPVVA